MERGERFGPALVDLSELTVAETALRRSREKNRRVVLRIQLQQSEQRTNHLPRVERTLVQFNGKFLQIQIQLGLLVVGPGFHTFQQIRAFSENQ